MDNINNYELIVIGNGFDLSQNYKTSYRDFFDFCKCASAKDFSELSQFVINKQYITDEELKDKESLLKNLQVKVKEGNLYLDYFFDIHKRLDKWADVEEELFIILSNLKSSIASLKQHIKSLINITPNIIQYTFPQGIEINPFLLYFHQKGKFEGKYNNNSRTTSSTFTIANRNNDYDGAKLKKKDEYFTYYCNETLYNIPFLFYEELKSFEKLFSDYLKIFAIPRKNHQPLNLRANSIINYNYTSIADSYVECKKSEIYHIHGKVNHDGEDNNIIFGIDNEQAEELGDDFTLFGKSVRRTINNTDYQHLQSVQYRSILIFGHSLSPMDDDSLKEILKNSINSLNCLTVYYTNKCSFDKEKHIMNLKRILGDIEFNQKRHLIHFECCD